MPAYFAFEQYTPKDELVEFVFKLDDEKKISEARDILKSGGARAICDHDGA